MSRQRRAELDTGHHQVGSHQVPQVPGCSPGYIIFCVKYKLGAVLPTGTDFQQSSGKIPSPGRLIYNLSVLPGNSQVWEREREGATGL